MLGIVPAAGTGSRIQPLAFSKELLPVGSRLENGTERPRAVSEYLIERMAIAGAAKICMVISPGKYDIMQYYGAEAYSASLCYMVQPRPAGLCDAIFQAVPLVEDNEPVVIGLPDTIWFPEDALCGLPDGIPSFLLFPVERPEYFDSVETAPDGRIERITVKSRQAASNWIWGALKFPGRQLKALHRLWQERDRRDEYIGTLVNAYLENGGRAIGVKAGNSYVDVGTVHGYREAMALLAGPA
ncbi:MAG: sugar phosphate nucleotidyltransferase [Actinomycetota bacterium]|nr:sugar phosphate nucleotidyltransferase [Actinomycetota bacterium]